MNEVSLFPFISITYKITLITYNENENLYFASIWQQKRSS